MTTVTTLTLKVHAERKNSVCLIVTFVMASLTALMAVMRHIATVSIFAALDLLLIKFFVQSITFQWLFD